MTRLKKTLKSVLKGHIPEDLLLKVPSSFDILGSRGHSIAIIEIPEILEEYESIIAESINLVHKNVDSVLGKKSKRDGEYRIRDYKLLWGNSDTEVIHKESGCLFKLDPQKTYFSPRESTERERITSKVTSGEQILVMFSGVGPIPICIAKKHPDTHITAIELNPYAHEYCVENIKLNKIEQQVTPILGDVREICPNINKLFNRIAMPLPKGAYKFLDLAIPLIKQSGILHFYHWAHEKELYKEAESLIRDAANNLQRNTIVIDRCKVSQYNPQMSKIRVDAKII